MTTPVDWPALDYAISWAAGPADNPVQNNWYSITDRTEGTTTVTRGKEYELDQVQPGDMAFTLRNDDGAFDPTNSSSPFAPKVVPYRLCRLRAQYPATSNLLTADQATAFHATKGAYTGATLPQWVTDLWGSFSIVPRDATTNAYNLPSGVSWPNQEFLRFTGMSVEAGVTYTAQMQFAAPSSVPVYLQLNFRDVNNGTISSVTGSVVTGTSGTITVTGTAPAGVFGASFSLYSAPQAGANPGATFFKAGWERNNTASAWVTPGTWYPIFAGYVERWPQGWDDTGNYGTSDLTAVDRFTWLANRGLDNPAVLEALALNPARLLVLDEASGATQFTDHTGNSQPATVYVPTSGIAQTLTPGNQLTGTSPPLGIDGPVVTFAPVASQNAARLIDLTGGGANSVLPYNPWTRHIAFRAPTTTALASTTKSLLHTQPKYPTGTTPSYLDIALQYDAAGNVLGINMVITNNGANACTCVITQPLSDGNWHLLTYALNGNTLSVWLDGVAQTVTNSSAVPTLNTTGATDVIGGQLAYATRKSTPGAACDVAFFAEYQAVLTNTQVANLWEAFRYAWGSQSPNRDETSDGRYQRLLAWAGVAGSARLSTGATVLYGPATGLNSDTRLLDALQAVTDTEAGQHFIGADGQVVFQSRRDRFNQAAVATFGEQAGEIAYTSAATDLDPTLVVNDVTATAQYGAGTSATSYRVTDASSVTTYGDLTTSRIVNTLDSAELLSAGQYVLYQGKQPLTRLEALPVNVGANPSYWPTLLGLELGEAVAVNRRPSNAPALAVTGFVEQIVWSIDDQRNASWTGQVSNSALHQFAQLDSATYGKFDSMVFGY